MVALETWTEHETMAQLEPADCVQLRRFFYRLSPQSVYRRFMSPIQSPDQLRLERLLDLDGRNRQALAMVLDGEIIGVARYARDPAHPGAAELAVVVADDWQRQGIATRLVRTLGEHARRAGFNSFEVLTLPDNYPALRLVKSLHSGAQLRYAGGMIEGEVPLGSGFA